MVLLILLLISNLVCAMDETSPLLADYKKLRKATSKTITVQYTTTVSDFDAVEFDSQKPHELLLGTSEGLSLYQVKKHLKGRCKAVPFVLYSLRKHCKKNHLVLSDKENIHIFNERSNKLSTIKNQQPSRVRFLPEKESIVAFYPQAIDIYDICTEKKVLSTTVDTIDGLVIVSDQELIDWNKDTIHIWDTRTFKKAVHAYSLDHVYSMAPNCTTLALGKSDGSVAFFDKRAMKKPSRVIKLSNQMENSIVNYREKEKDFIAVCENKIVTIDQNMPAIKDNYKHDNPTIRWVASSINSDNVMALRWWGSESNTPTEYEPLVSVVDLHKAT